MAITIQGVKRKDRYTMEAGEWPNATNTGYLGSLGALTASSADMVITTNNQVIELLDLAGTIRVQAQNVVIRNMRITSNAFWPILVDDGFSASITDVTIAAGDDSQACAGGDGMTILRLNGYGGGDGVKLGTGCTITDSYIHDLGGGPGAHNDGIECNASNILVDHCRVLNQNAQTSAISIEPSLSNVIVRNSYIAGGGYTMYAGNTAAVNVKILNNTWGTDFFPDGGSFGAYAFQAPIGSNGNEWSGNTLNGSPLN